MLVRETIWSPISFFEESLYFPHVLSFHISNMMSAQEQLQLTMEAVKVRGLSRIHSKVALFLWANRHDHLLHPLVETRLNEIPSSQMTQADELIMYHVQSFTKEPETVASNFSNASKEELYHAQSQEQPRPTSPAFPKFVLSSS